MSSSKETFIIAGLEVNVYYATPTIITERKEVAIFFLLHGRSGSAAEFDPTARSLIEQIASKGKARNVLVVTFDHRNHGKRLVDPKGNEAWSKDRASPKHNERHAVDMYAIQTGSARDVSLLIDFLPSYLYPDDDPSPIVEWGIAGVSLGGHSTWIALATDSRLTTGIPIIGCPDYNKLIAYRANYYGIELAGKYFPKSLKDNIAKCDPASLVRGASNPFEGKKILVLSGAADRLVPWEASKEFVTEKLNTGANGVKKVSLYPGVGHECTEGMVREMVEFITDNCL